MKVQDSTFTKKEQEGFHNSDYLIYPLKSFIFEIDEFFNSQF